MCNPYFDMWGVRQEVMYPGTLHARSRLHPQHIPALFPGCTVREPGTETMPGAEPALFRGVPGCCRALTLLLLLSPAAHFHSRSHAAPKLFKIQAHPSFPDPFHQIPGDCG